MSEDAANKLTKEQNSDYLLKLFDLQLRQRKREVDEVKYLLGLGLASLLFVTSNLSIPSDKSTMSFFHFSAVLATSGSIIFAFFSYTSFYKSEQTAFDESINALMEKMKSEGVSFMISHLGAGTAGLKNAYELKSWSYALFVMALISLIVEALG